MVLRSHRMVAAQWLFILNQGCAGMACTLAVHSTTTGCVGVLASCLQAEAAQQQVPKGPPLVQFSLAEMDAARELLSAEVEVVRGAMGHSSYSQEEYIEAWGVVIADMVFDDKVGVRG